MGLTTGKRPLAQNAVKVRFPPLVPISDVRFGEGFLMRVAA
jgi:hypothetical protein